MSRPILVVDDDLDILESMCLILEPAGYVVLTAPCGQKALQLLHQGAAPGLILVDLMMPIMDGWEFVAEVQHDPTLAAIPIVVLSGGVRRSEQVASLSVADYLQKPVDIKALFSVIRQYA